MFAANNRIWRALTSATRALGKSVRATQITRFGCDPGDQAHGQVVDQIGGYSRGAEKRTGYGMSSLRVSASSWNAELLSRSAHGSRAAVTAVRPERA